MATLEVAWTDAVIAVSEAVTALLAAAGFAILVIGGIVALLQLKSGDRTREGQLLTDISRRWEEGEIFKARCELLKFQREDGLRLAEELRNLRDKGDRRFLTLMSVPNFFEDVGILVENGALRLEVVQASLGRVIRFPVRRVVEDILADPV